MSTKGYFLDLDGTLVDTNQSNVSAYLGAISEVLPNTQVDRDALRAGIAAGKNYRTFLRELISDISDDQLTAISEHKADIYPGCLRESILNEPLVSRMREWRQDPDAVLVLVTTAKERNARNVLEHHDITGLFDFAVFGDQVSASKPNPEIYLKALELAGVSAADAKAFEDSDVGIEAAQAAGISVTRIVWEDQ